MAILIKNTLIDEMLIFLQSLDWEAQPEAENLYHELLADRTEHEKEELRIEGELPIPDKAGAYII